MATNPKYLGPGYWASWHLKTIHADTESKKAEIARNIALDIQNFPCMDCKNHAKTYVSRNPLIKAVKSTHPLSLFAWTINFHNHVNLRLNKKIYQIDEARKMWSGETVCTENCGNEDPPEKEQTVTEQTDSENIGEMLIRGF